MEQFNQLPLPQKVLVLIVAMVAVAGLFYYATIMPLHDEAASQEAAQGKIKKDIAKLKKKAEKVKPADVAKKKSALDEQTKAFKKRLPLKEEMETFIIGIGGFNASEGSYVITIY